MKRLLKSALRAVGYECKRLPGRATSPNIPDAEFYAPLFSPWLGYNGFGELYHRVAPYTIVSPDRCYVLRSLAQQASFLDGEFWECGVYKGGTAMLLSEVAPDIPLCLFDTFEGMPKTDPQHDIHQAGDFADTSVEAVRQRAPSARIHRGTIPHTFEGLENSRIALAHIDVDIYRSVWDCCEFIYPRVVSGGFMVFDDYGFPSCPGARKAVDEYFVNHSVKPVILGTGQAVVWKA